MTSPLISGATEEGVGIEFDPSTGLCWLSAIGARGVARGRPAMTLTLLHDMLILTLDPESNVIDGGYVLVRDHFMAEDRTTSFAKLKHLLLAARIVDALYAAIGQLLEAFTRGECANYFRNAGYALT